MRKVGLMAVVASIFIGCQTTTKDGDKPKAKVSHSLKQQTTVEGITEYRMDNGLKVLFFPDPSKAKVTVNITYFVGSRHEGYGEAGMAHLLEHMVFKGTPTRPNIWEALTEKGAQFNGTTWTDRTNYYETLPATDENLAWALSMEADRMINSKIDPKDLAKEFSVVRNEFQMGENSPFRVLLARLHSAAFLWHNYGNSTIGNRSDIERVPAESLKRFYKKYYQPDNAMLVVAGKFDKDKAKALVEKHFGTIPRPERKLPKTYTTEPVQDGERLVTLRRNGENPLAGVLYHIPSGDHEDYVAMDAIAYILSTKPNGILYRDFVTKGTLTSVYSTTFGWHDPGTFWAVAEMNPKQNPKQVLDQITKRIENLSPAEIKKEEVERFKKKTLSEIRVADANSQQIAIELSEWAALGDWRLRYIYRDRIESLTTEAVRKAYKKYMLRSNRTAGIFIPTKNPVRATIPPKPDTSKLVASYKGKKTVAMGEAFDPSFENIKSRLKTLKLKSGNPVAALSKRTRGEKIFIEVGLRYGNANSLLNKGLIEYFTPILMTRGSRNLSYQQLKDRLVAIDSGISGGNSSDGVAKFSISTEKKHLEEVLKIFNELLNQPRFDAEEFDVFKKQILSSLRSQLSEPRSIASEEMEKAMNPFPKDSVHHVYSTKDTIAQVEKLTLDQVRNFYRQFYTTKNATYSVVGDFDDSKIASLLNKTIKPKSSKITYKEIVKPLQSNIATSKVVNTPDKKGAMVMVGHTLSLGIDDPKYASSKLAGFVFGQSASSRMNNRLRQKEGFAYGAWGGFSPAAQGDYAQFTAGAICGPENAQRALEIIIEEVKLFADKGLTKDEMTKAKSGYAEQEKTRFANDKTLASLLEFSLRSKLNLDFYIKRSKAIQSLTLEQVNRDIKTMVQANRLTKVVAADLKKAKK
ncbi:MAG: insulinase family protein [Pseudobacteriovorax sp.]|nr:insulinase family protein [Pseudobacteriovorax sp.]